MPSSLLNEPHPNTIVHRYDLMGRDALTPDEDVRERKARAYYLDLAANGDAEAKLMLRSHPRWRLKRWYRKGIGEIL